LISQKSKQTDRFALKGLFLSAKHNSTTNSFKKSSNGRGILGLTALSFYKLLKYSRRVFYVKKVKNLEFFRENLIFEYFPPQKVGEQNF